VEEADAVRTFLTESGVALLLFPTEMAISSRWVAIGDVVETFQPTWELNWRSFTFDYTEVSPP
jgi:hypothetical protein